MSVKDEVLAKVAEEKQEVAEKLTELFAKIQSLEDAIAGGGVVSADDLVEIKDAIGGIFVKG